MTLPHDHQVAAWLTEDTVEAPSDSLARALAATHRTRKRPRWTFPARWLPITLTTTRTPMRRTILGLVMLALLMSALVATAVFVGSERTDLPISGDTWPQSTADEVRLAQERAEAGDPEYTWQVDPQLAADAWAYLEVNDPAPVIVDRFLRERSGWDHYMFLEHEGDFDSDDGSGSPDGMVHRRVIYLRCAAGENPLYPTAPCAPTIDDRRFETVSLDIAQPGVHGPTGIWVASVWRTPAPFVQAEPNESAARALVEAFLAARIAGEGAERLIDVASDAVPLLYATSTGARYDRFESELVHGPRWPDGGMEFKIRLVADDGRTVVGQRVRSDGSGLSIDPLSTTENGEPMPVRYAFLDDLVAVSAAEPWKRGIERWALELGDRPREAIIFVADPHASEVGCGYSPAFPDADALARSLLSDPDLEATDPDPTTIGGANALRMDVVLAPGATTCDGASPVLRLPGIGDRSTDRGSANLTFGDRARLYLVDLPEGSASRILAIAVVAPEGRFDAVMDAAAPVLDSIAFPTLGDQ